jgi:predicted lysophospholipase L1 biosynthesis ABC-type transport system permease subunit
MLEPLKVPLATALYTLLGLLLATFWYDDVHWPLWTAVAAAIVLALGVAPIARAQITRKPVIALRVFEAYGWINGLVAAVATCTTVLVSVELGALGGKDDPVKELVTQVTTALTSLIGGIVVATKDADATLGRRIAREFQSRFTLEGQPDPGDKLALKRGSPSLLAVFTKYENGWTDWSEDNRAARIRSLDENLAADRA